MNSAQKTFLLLPIAAANSGIAMRVVEPMLPRLAEHFATSVCRPRQPKWRRMHEPPALRCFRCLGQAARRSAPLQWVRPSQRSAIRRCSFSSAADSPPLHFPCGCASHDTESGAYFRPACGSCAGMLMPPPRSDTVSARATPMSTPFLRPYDSTTAISASAIGAIRFLRASAAAM